MSVHQTAREPNVTTTSFNSAISDQSFQSSFEKLQKCTPERDRQRTNFGFHVTQNIEVPIYTVEQPSRLFINIACCHDSWRFSSVFI